LAFGGANASAGAGAAAAAAPAAPALTAPAPDAAKYDAAEGDDENLEAGDDEAGAGGGGVDPEEDLAPSVFGKTYQLLGRPSGTGEEGEECLVQVRAKLYRLTQAQAKAPASGAAASSPDGGAGSTAAEAPAPVPAAPAPAATAGMGEWLEVGVGPVRILRAAKSPGEAAESLSKARVVMRREEKKGGAGTKVLLNLLLKPFSKATKQSDKLLQLTSLAPSAAGSDLESCAYLFKFGAAGDCENMHSQLTACIAAAR
jgi:hypothetical protein